MSYSTRLRSGLVALGRSTRLPAASTDVAPVDAERAPRGASYGQVIIMLAFFLVSLMGILGLAVDLGFAFAARRAVQGAADAGAMAGARQIARYTTAAPVSALSQVTSVVTSSNYGAVNPTVNSCEYIGNNWSVVGVCSSNVPSTAAGARVRTRATFPTFFIQVVPGAPSSVSVAGYAKARVQAGSLGTTFSDAPFIVCGTKTWAVKDKFGVDYSSPTNIPIVSGSNISQSAIGVTFRIYDSTLNTGSTGTVKKDAGCKAVNASFHGMANQGLNGSKSLNSWFKYATSGSPGSTLDAVKGVEGCAASVASPYNCVMILPIATDSPVESGSNTELYVTRWAPFLISSPSAGVYNAKLLDDYITSGVTATDTWCRDCGGIVVIRIIW